MDFSKCRSWNILDEYVGLKPDHVCSYRRFMNEELFDHVNIDPANTRVPSGLAADIGQGVRPTTRRLHRGGTGGVDLQLLGIGRNGHIGFNEPADALRPRRPTVVTLTERDHRGELPASSTSADEVPQVRPPAWADEPIMQAKTDRAGGRRRGQGAGGHPRRRVGRHHARRCPPPSSAAIPTASSSWTRPPRPSCNSPVFPPPEVVFAAPGAFFARAGRAFFSRVLRRARQISAFPCRVSIYVIMEAVM